jgi:hypothetical protein
MVSVLRILMPMPMHAMDPGLIAPILESPELLDVAGVDRD